MIYVTGMIMGAWRHSLPHLASTEAYRFHDALSMAVAQTQDYEQI